MKAAMASALLEDSLKRAHKESAPPPSSAADLDPLLRKYEVGDILQPPKKQGATDPLARAGRRGLRDRGPTDRGFGELDGGVGGSTLGRW